MKKSVPILVSLAALALTSCTAYNYEEYYSRPVYRPPVTYPGTTVNYNYYVPRAPVSGGGSAYTGGYSGGGAETFQAVERPASYSY